MKILLIGLIAGLLAQGPAFAQSSLAVKDANSVTQTVKTFNCSSTICPLSVPADTTGTALGTAGNPFRVDPTGTTAQTVSQGTAANLNATVVQGTAANLNATVVQGTAANLNATVVGSVSLTGATNNINNIAGTISLPTGAASATNQTKVQTPVTAGAATATAGVLLGGQFDTTQKTLTNGQQAAFSASSRGAMFVATGADTFNVTVNAALPAGANVIGHVITDDTSTTAVTQATAANLNATVVNAGTFAVQLSGSTNNINNVAGTISLPTGAATSANQTNASQKTQLVDGSGNVIASTSNNLNVQCANCSGSGASAADQASFTAGSSTFAPSGGFFQTTATSNPLTTGTQGLVQMTAQRAFFTNLRNASGTEVGTAGAPLQVSVANTGANGTAMLVTGTAGTFPVTALSIVTQGTALGSTSVELVGASVTTNAPTFTTGQINQLSMTTAGGLRIDLKDTAANTNALNVSLAAETTKVIGTVNQGTSPWVVSGTVTAANASVVTQGTALGSTSVTLAGASVGTNAPTFTTGQINQLSMTTAGGLRIDLKDTASNTNNLNVAQATAANLNATVVQATGTNLHVVCDSGCSSSTAPADESAFTAGSTSQSPVGGFFQTTATNNALTTGQMGAFQVTANRALFSNLRNAAGTEVGTSSAEVFVGGRGTAGTATGGVLTVQGVASMTKLLVTPDSVALPANQSVNVSQVNGVTTLTGTGAVGTGTIRVAVGTDSATVAGSASIPAGTNLMGKVGVDQTTPGTTNAVSVAQIGATTVVNGGTAGTLGIGGAVAAGSAVSGANPVLAGLSDGTNNRAWLNAANSLNSTGAGIGTSQIVGQCDDTSPTALTENQFGNLRMDCTDHSQTMGGITTTAAPSYTTATARALSLTTAGGLRTDTSSIAGTTTVTAASGVQKVGVVGNAGAIFDGATAAAVPANAIYHGGNGSGNLTGFTVCDNWTAISQTAGTQIIAGVSAKKTYICAINIVSATAQNIALVGGTGTVCATSTHAISGGTTAATGWNFAANGGLTQGSGVGVIMQAGTAADNLCLLMSSSGQLSGTISWTQY